MVRTAPATWVMLVDVEAVVALASALAAGSDVKTTIVWFPSCCSPRLMLLLLLPLLLPLMLPLQLQQMPSLHVPSSPCPVLVL